MLLFFVSPGLPVNDVKLLYVMYCVA